LLFDEPSLAPSLVRRTILSDTIGANSLIWQFGWIGKWAQMFEPINDSANRNWKIWLVFTALVITLIASLIWVLRMTQMPLKFYAGQLPPLTGRIAVPKDLANKQFQFTGFFMAVHRRVAAGGE
jgi:hypothetical protein